MEEGHHHEGEASSADGAAGLRKIIHVDMDAFFASVEQRDHPELRGKPVAVGGSRERGVVAAASYEARRFGVRSAMPSVRARKLCPDLIFMPPRFDVYREVSRQVRAIFAEHTPIIEPMSLDEAYLDVTENLKGLPSATAVAEEIRAAIRRETGLTASAGVSYNKFLSKMASDFRKPDGLYVITPGMGPEFVAALEIGRFHGIGPATMEKMHRLGIFIGADLRRQSLEFLRQHFGKAGSHFHSISRGIDLRPVEPNQERKSIGAENTFARDLFREDELLEELVPLAVKVWQHSERIQAYGRTVTLKVKYEDFQQITRSRTLPHPVTGEEEIRSAAISLLQALLPSEKGIRLVGVTVSGFPHAHDAEEPSRQLSFDL